MKPNNILYLKCPGDAFYRVWIEMLTPVHKLTPRERDVAARILAQYFRLKRQITDPDVLNDLLWSSKSRRDMMESLGMSQAHFQMTLARLRAAGVLLKDDFVEPRYIPHITDEPRFMLQIIFDCSTPDNPIRNVQKQDNE